eukprot:g65941.t1
MIISDCGFKSIMRRVKIAPHLTRENFVLISRNWAKLDLAHLVGGREEKVSKRSRWRTGEQKGRPRRQKCGKFPGHDRKSSLPRPPVLVILLNFPALEGLGRQEMVCLADTTEVEPIRRKFSSRSPQGLTGLGMIYITIATAIAIYSYSYSYSYAISYAISYSYSYAISYAISYSYS